MHVNAYDYVLFFHILLFVVWLGVDLGVFTLGQYFRKRELPMETRLTVLRILVICDMLPRSAWALMVPTTLTLLYMGNWWVVPSGAAIPGALVAFSWVIGGFWLWLVWTAFIHDQTPKAAVLRKYEFWLKIFLTAFYLWLGGQSVTLGYPLEANWLASKALIFGVIFAFAIMIDVAFKPLGPALGELIQEGSTTEREDKVLHIMNNTRKWVVSLYFLLFVTGFLGTTKPF
ncbi:MAG: hypothetical protein AAF607_09810 [Pseudomonadota bacterium]